VSENKLYLLDSSALFTLIEDEPGAEKVETLLREREIIIPWLCLMELHYISQQEQGLTEADRRYALLRATRATILWQSTEPILLTAARLKAQHRISLADSVIAAFAIAHKAVLLHKDPEYEALKGQLELEALPYK
jgi:predicted nucleic acid-binding protein